MPNVVCFLVQGWHESLLLDMRAFMAPGWNLLSRLLGPLTSQLSAASLKELADTVN